MITAIIGLVGALGGVAIGAALTELRDRRREMRDRRDEVRVAARLVGQELQAGYTRVLAPSGGRTELPVDAWRGHRTVLARAMDERGWRDLASLYAVLELADGGQPLSEEAERLFLRAQAKLDGLLIWTRDEFSEEEALYGYQRHLEKMLEARRQQREP